MKPRRTLNANLCLKLPGGTDENDLWVEAVRDVNDQPAMLSTWRLDDDDRAAIARGADVELIVWGTGHPPVAIRLNDRTAPVQPTPLDPPPGEPIEGGFKRRPRYGAEAHVDEPEGGGETS